MAWVRLARVGLAQVGLARVDIALVRLARVSSDNSSCLGLVYCILLDSTSGTAPLDIFPTIYNLRKSKNSVKDFDLCDDKSM